MAFLQKKHPLAVAVKWIAGSILLLVMVGALLVGIAGAAVRSKEEGRRQLEENVRRAAVQCYALEGFYPPSVEYLEENWGLSVDHSQYAVHYEAFASNFLPEITVVMK